MYNHLHACLQPDWVATTGRQHGPPPVNHFKTKKSRNEPFAKAQQASLLARTQIHCAAFH